jgi:hypothetical protein
MKQWWARSILVLWIKITNNLEQSRQQGTGQTWKSSEQELLYIAAFEILKICYQLNLNKLAELRKKINLLP